MFELGYSENCKKCGVSPGLLSVAFYPAGNLVESWPGYRLSSHRVYVLSFRLSMQIPDWCVRLTRGLPFLNLCLLNMVCRYVDKTSSDNRVLIRRWWWYLTVVTVIFTPSSAICSSDGQFSVLHCYQVNSSIRQCKGVSCLCAAFILS